MTCSENDCMKGIDFQCPYCESDYCRDHIDNHSLCDIIVTQNTLQTNCTEGTK